MLLFAFAACHQPDAETDDPNLTTWSGPVALSADYTVAPGMTLSIEPGTTVTLAAGVAIVVQGELLARGTVEAPITFTGDAAAPWRSIVFEAGATAASFDGVDTYAQGSIVDNTIVEHAGRGMELDGASPYLHAVTFRDNVITPTVVTIGGAGLLVKGGATPRIRDCRFEDNLASNFAFGGAIYVDHADPIVQDNVFVGNVSTYGGAVATDFMASPFVGNDFEDNDSQSEGGALSLVSTVSAVLANTVVGNHSKTDGGGIHVCVDCNPHAAPFLLDNVVTGNTNDASDPDDGAAGVGAAFLGALTDNEIHDNLRDGGPSDFSWFNLVSEAWPAWVAAPALSGNWWGTTDRSKIDITVYDGADSGRYGTVALDPIRTGPPAGPIPRVVLASRKIRYEDAGDEVPVFLTVYNPGPALSATIAITRDGAPFDGDLGYPGATRSGDRWAVDLPENSVWFGTIDSSTYDGTTIADVTWEATLLDDGGAPIGTPGVSRYLYGLVDGS